MKKILFRKILLDCLLFFFISLISTSIIIWVFQAVNFLDIIVEDGRDFIVYLSYSILNFPKIISKIIPFYSKHSERRRLKLDRLQLIALSAMKQSKSLFLPEIIEPISFKDLLKMESVNQKCLAYMEEETTTIDKLIPTLTSETSKKNRCLANANKG